MKYAALGLLATAFVLQLSFVYWMNSDIDRTPRRAKDPWLANEGTAHLYAIKPPQVGRDRFRATNPKLGEEVVHGYVHDLQNAPVQGALVVVEQRNLSPEAALAPSSRIVRWDGTTDARGYFLFDALPPGEFVLSAFGENSHALALCHLSKDGASAELNLKLEPSARLSGVVLDSSGAPLPNVQVYPMEAEREKGSEAYRYYPARSDKEGRFTLEHIREGAWDLLVASRGSVPTLFPAVPPTDQPVQLQLQEGATIAGQILAQEDSSPVAGIALTAVEERFGSERYQARTDKQGRFQFGPMRPAQYQIQIDSNRWASVDAVLSVSVAPGAPEPSILVEKTGALRGRVIAASTETQGIPEAIVRAVPKSGAGEAFEDETDLGGYYQFPGLKAGEYELNLQLPEQYAQSENRPLSATVVANQRTEGPTFSVAGSIAILGVVRDEAGAPVAGANVRVSFGERGTKQRDTRSRTDGSFSFRGFGEQDSVTLWAEKLGRQSEAFGPVELGKTGLNSVELKLGLSNGGTIAGRVVNAQGTGIGGAPVTCLPGGATKAPTLHTTSTANGAFSFKSLPAGTYTLQVARSSKALEAGTLNRELTISDNQHLEDVEVVLP